MTANDSAFPHMRVFMMADRDGGPSRVSGESAEGGLTKREWFAGMAMQGLAASDVIQGYLKEMFRTGQHSANQGTQGIAKSAVNLADALIKELEK